MGAGVGAGGYPQKRRGIGRRWESWGGVEKVGLQMQGSRGFGGQSPETEPAAKGSWGDQVTA